MIQLKAVRFTTPAIALPGARTQGAIDLTRRQADKADFDLIYDPRMRLVMIKILRGAAEGTSMAVPAERCDFIEFDTEALEAFRAKQPAIDQALATRRVQVAAGK